jgi:large subunit ribosomal protein L5
MKSTRLSEKYQVARKKVMGDFDLKNVNATPRIDRVVVNAGLGEMTKSKEFKAQAISDFATITGQQPAVRQAKISVASFAVRAGMPVGLKVTLRREKMFSFLDRVFSIVLPRLRDFKGTSNKSFDEAGNYTIGFAEHTVFPEIDLGKSPKAFGLEMTIVIKNSTPEKSKSLLAEMGLPFVKD